MQSPQVGKATTASDHGFALVQDLDAGSSSTGPARPPSRNRKLVKFVGLVVFLLGVAAVVIALTTWPVEGESAAGSDPSSAARCVDPATIANASVLSIPDGSPVCANVQAWGYTILDFMTGQATPMTNYAGNLLVVGGSFLATTGGEFLTAVTDRLVTITRPQCDAFNAIGIPTLQKVLSSMNTPIDSGMSIFVSVCGGQAFVLGTGACISIAVHPPQCVGRAYLTTGVSMGLQAGGSIATSLDFLSSGNCDDIRGAFYGGGVTAKVVTGFGASISNSKAEQSYNPSSPFDRTNVRYVTVTIPGANTGMGFGIAGSITSTSVYTCPNGVPSSISTIASAVRAQQANPQPPPASYWDFTGRVGPFCTSAYNMGARPYQTWGNFPIGAPNAMTIYNAYACNSVLVVMKYGLRGYETWGNTPLAIQSQVGCMGNCVSWSINYGAAPGKPSQPMPASLQAGYATCNCDTLLGAWINSVDSVAPATAFNPNAPAVTSTNCRGPLTPDQSCGMAPNYYSCASGKCCSQYGWCGSTPDHCNGGSLCLTAVAAPSVLCIAGRPTPDQSCGTAPYYYSCSLGKCCSENGWCGTTTDYCNAKSLCR